MTNSVNDHMLLAIEAASKEINKLAVQQGADNDPELWYDEAAVAIKAAEPYFRAMIAEENAQESESIPNIQQARSNDSSQDGTIFEQIKEKDLVDLGRSHNVTPVVVTQQTDHKATFVSNCPDLVMELDRAHKMSVSGIEAYNDPTCRTLYSRARDEIKARIDLEEQLEMALQQIGQIQYIKSSD